MADEVNEEYRDAHTKEIDLVNRDPTHLNDDVVKEWMSPYLKTSSRPIPPPPPKNPLRYFLHLHHTEKTNTKTQETKNCLLGGKHRKQDKLCKATCILHKHKILCIAQNTSFLCAKDERRKSCHENYPHSFHRNVLKCKQNKVHKKTLFRKEQEHF
nr:caveolin-1 isoform X3 [Pogona vitticeps]XP_020645347.1 caveolin-1 isoform X3 [Pogona vitticeps]XP_020645348.1 caveolin-1 isoform X3 [Pogona vitticeps]